MTDYAADRCRRYRRRILEISQQVSAAHVAPAFSCMEIVDALYHEIMRPQDIFIMSKGHGCLAQYVVLEDMRWERERECDQCGGSGFDTPGTGYGNVCGECGGQRYKEPRLLDAYCCQGGILGAHPDYNPARGIHASTGSLGHGLGIAAGQALAEKMKGTDVCVYVLLSDGECQEGSTWEAAMAAANLRLGNLIALVDVNGWGGMDKMVSQGANMSPKGIEGKFQAFGWSGSTFDGHDMRPVFDGMSALHRWLAPKFATHPRVAVCRTVKGKGVSFIEDGQPLWHYRSPNAEEYQRALEELT